METIANWNERDQMNFVYVQGETNKDKMLALGYELIKSDSKGRIFIFKNKDEALKFGLNDELEQSDISFITSNVLTF